MTLPRALLGDHVHYLPEVTSTNDVALAFASSGAPQGTVVCADAQTAGRGRLGRSWFSPPGAGVYASIILRPPGWPIAAIAAITGREAETADPTAMARALGLVTLTAGVALAESLRATTSIPIEIKWPNDLVVVDPSARSRGFRKLGGILAEASSEEGGARVQHIVVGFGVGVSRASYPPELRDRATSIEDQTGRRFDRWELLATALSVLTRRFHDLAAGRFSEILSAWRRLAPSTHGARVAWMAADRRRSGVVQDIDDHGALLVQNEDGVERIVAGDLEWELG